MSKSSSVVESGVESGGALPRVGSSPSSIFWSIILGILFGAAIGGAVGIALRPRRELDELSHELLDEFRDVTDRVSGIVRQQVREIVTKRPEPSGDYEEYPESVV